MPITETTIQQAKSLIECETNLTCALANLSSLLFYAYNHDENVKNKVNWLGFYRPLNKDELVLSCFQGKVACTRIKMNKGVCGTVWKQKRMIRVPDVHEFEGHIACDSASQSELVCPVIVSGEMVALIDIDALEVDFFGKQDEEMLLRIADLLSKYWGNLSDIPQNK